jgi:hypothetical protein
MAGDRFRRPVSDRVRDVASLRQPVGGYRAIQTD